MCKRHRDSFENKLTKLDEGLSKPRARTSVAAVWKRIGRMIANSGGMGQHYEITVETDEAEERVVKVNWTYEAQPNTMASTPGVYCLRTNMLDMEAEALWRTYVMLTDLESVFRSLKSELGLRPIYHLTDRRTEGHLFITVLAYQVVQVIRLRLRQKGLTLSWGPDCARDSRHRSAPASAKSSRMARRYRRAAPAIPTFSPSDPDSGQNICCDQIGPKLPIYPQEWAENPEKCQRWIGVVAANVHRMDQIVKVQQKRYEAWHLARRKAA